MQSLGVDVIHGFGLPSVYEMAGRMDGLVFCAEFLHRISCLFGLVTCSKCKCVFICSVNSGGFGYMSRMFSSFDFLGILVKIRVSETTTATPMIQTKIYVPFPFGTIWSEVYLHFSHLSEPMFLMSKLYSKLLLRECSGSVYFSSRPRGRSLSYEAIAVK